jgi:hypothetical protein
LPVTLFFSQVSDLVVIDRQSFFGAFSGKSQTCRASVWQSHCLKGWDNPDTQTH